MTIMHQEPLGLRAQILSFKRALTVPELASILAISKGTVYTYARNGNIRAIRIGTLVRFDPNAVVEWLEKQ